MCRLCRRTCSREPPCFHASSSEKRILVPHHRDCIPMGDARRPVVSQRAKTSQTRLAPPSAASVTSTAIADDSTPHPSPVPIVLWLGILPPPYLHPLKRDAPKSEHGPPFILIVLSPKRTTINYLKTNPNYAASHHPEYLICASGKKSGKSIFEQITLFVTVLNHHYFFFLFLIS